MKLLGALLVAMATWGGLLIGVAAGAAFGAIAGVTAICAATLNPSFYRELRAWEAVVKQLAVGELKLDQ